MSRLAEEIADQPSAWAQAIALGENGPDSLCPGERLAVIGCGTSWHVAKSIAALRESLGLGETDAFAASEVPVGRRYDRVLAISRSGTTTEVRDALAAIDQDVPVIAVVGDPDSPIAAAADDVVDLSFANDLSVVQSRFVTTILCLVRAWFGEDISDLPRQAEAALTRPAPVQPDQLKRAFFLGQNWRIGVAEAAALCLRETAQMWAEAYPAMEYRHGPIATAGPGAVVWFLDDPPVGLKEQAAATGARTEVGQLDPLAELIRVQRLALAIAEAAGHDPDHPPNLTRAVVLDEETG